MSLHCDCLLLLLLFALLLLLLTNGRPDDVNGRTYRYLFDIENPSFDARTVQLIDCCKTNDKTERTSERASQPRRDGPTTD